MEDATRRAGTACERAVRARAVCSRLERNIADALYLSCESASVREELQIRTGGLDQGPGPKGGGASPDGRVVCSGRRGSSRAANQPRYMRRVKRVAASVRAASEAASATAILSRGRPITGSGRPQVNQSARRDDEDDDDGGGNVQPSRRDVYVRRCDGQKGRWMSGPPEDVASDQVTIALANAGKSRREASNVGMNRSNGLEACQAAGPDMSSVVGSMAPRQAASS